MDCIIVVQLMLECCGDANWACDKVNSKSISAIVPYSSYSNHVLVYHL